MAALNGDGRGVYRIHIVGNSGESTLADELAALLGVPAIHLDTLFWEPGWVEAPNDVFRARLSAALAADACLRGWVVDGNFDSRLNGLLDSATDIIWLDTPFLLYFPRLLVRTLQRLLRRRPQCAPGCDESAREAFFSRNSILLWALSNHAPARRKGCARLRDDPVRVRRIGGWGGELAAWKADVARLVGKGK
ncbi:hypothetical protein M0805_006661 [Coniferiporia weirii]|nr:hypothetical protein M0805_006661 [Coniferiporia weirii]